MKTIIFFFLMIGILSSVMARQDCLDVLYDFSLPSKEKKTFVFSHENGVERKYLEFSVQEYMTNGCSRFRMGILQGKAARKNSELILSDQKSCWDMVTNNVMSKKRSHVSQSIPIDAAELCLQFSQSRDERWDRFSSSFHCPASTGYGVSRKILETYSKLCEKLYEGDAVTYHYQSLGKESICSSVISFSDAFYTPFRYLRREVICRGKLERNDCGHFSLRPVDREMWGLDHVVHVQKIPMIHLEIADDDLKSFNCHLGKSISVRGTLSSIGDENIGQNELESGFVCIQNPSIVTNGETSIESPSSVSCSYISPCREFKLKLHTTDGFICLVHYYSARLWVARYVVEDGSTIICSVVPQSLYATLWDSDHERKITRIWKQLARIEKGLQNKGYSAERSKAGMYLAYPYSEINEVELYGEKCPDIQSTVFEMFEDWAVGLPKTSSSP